MPADQLSSWSGRLKGRLQPRLAAPQMLNRAPAQFVQPKRCSVRQIINKIIHRDPGRQRRPLLRIASVIRPFPRIAQIHVVADRDHHPPLALSNSSASVQSFPSLLPPMSCGCGSIASRPPGSDRPDRKSYGRSGPSSECLQSGDPEKPGSCWRQTLAIRSDTLCKYGSSP